MHAAAGDNGSCSFVLRLARDVCSGSAHCAQGRPKDGPEDKFRLTPVVPRLSELLGTTVRPQLCLPAYVPC